MSRIFLGRPAHWLIAIALIAGGAWLGDLRLHVRDFNTFLVYMLIGTIAAVALTLFFSGKGSAPITRDPIPRADEPEIDADEPEQAGR